MPDSPPENANVLAHFTARAGHYDASSHWCTDAVLLDRMRELLALSPDHHLLDVACGTGLVSRAMRPHVATITGVDITPAMFDQARDCIDTLHAAPAESLPLEDASVDRVVCRQGIQFMDAPAAVAEMVRVTRPGGRIVLADLCAWGSEDREETFEVLRLRNPARRNFWLADDLPALLRTAGCEAVEAHSHISREVVDVWSDNRAIAESRRDAIRKVYANASEPFRRLHNLERTESGFVDHMRFELTVGIV
jgi:ubiquinone/menaquinone biosynthesis C-methylase UbiE